MHLLWIDDEPQIVAVSARFLATCGFQIEYAQDGYAGLALARGARFDLIILDMKMPGLDGLAVLQALRADGVSTPVMAFTAHGDEFAFRAGQLGALSYRDKPLAGIALAAAIRETAALLPGPVATPLFRVPHGGRAHCIDALLTGLDWTGLDSTVRCCRARCINMHSSANWR